MKIGITFVLIGSIALAQGQGKQGPAAPPSPAVQPDGRVSFYLFAPKASTVTVEGDHPLASGFHGGRKVTAMAKDDKGVWSVTTPPLKPDIYNYYFVVDGVRTLDPQNVHLGRNTNWVIVPGAESANYQVNDVPHGRVSEVWYPSPSLKMTRRMFVYTPPGYEGSSTRYPVFYLLHGGGEDELAWPIVGRAPQILDNLLAQKKIVPMIVAMPYANVRAQLAPRDATAPPLPLPAGTPANSRTETMVYPNSIVNDIIPFMDTNYRTIADRDHRAIAGTSAGGALTILTGLRNVDKFSYIGLFSPALARVPGAEISIPLPPDADARRGPDLGVSIDPVKFAEFFPVLGPDLNKRLHVLYLSVGGAEGLLEEEKAGAKVFDEKGVKYTWIERPGYGHEWSFWRLDLQDFSARLFK